MHAAQKPIPLLREFGGFAACATALTLAFLQKIHAFLRHGHRAIQVHKITRGILAATLRIAVFNPCQLRCLQRGLLVCGQQFTQFAERLVQRFVGLRKQIASAIHGIESVTRFGATSGLGTSSHSEGGNGQRQ